LSKQSIRSSAGTEQLLAKTLEIFCHVYMTDSVVALRGYDSEVVVNI